MCGAGEDGKSDHKTLFLKFRISRNARSKSFFRNKTSFTSVWPPIHTADPLYMCSRICSGLPLIGVLINVLINVKERKEGGGRRSEDRSDAGEKAVCQKDYSR